MKIEILRIVLFILLSFVVGVITPAAMDKRLLYSATNNDSALLRTTSLNGF